MKIHPIKRQILLLVALGALVSGGCATTPHSGRVMTIQTGQVVASRPVDLPSRAGQGVAVGGLVGYAATSSRHGSSRRARNMLLGAAAGGVIAGSAEGSPRGMEYTVELGSGARIQIATDQTEIRIGDCVNVEQAGRGTGNVRRVSQSYCEAVAESAVDADIQNRMTTSADLCLTAKDAVFEADTEAEIEAAVRRVNILCDD